MDVAALVLDVPHRLTHLSPINILILILYFAVVLFIGFYVKASTNASEDFSLPGGRCRRGSPA